jgi:hypothetical protein
MPALTLSLGLRGNLLSSTAPTPAFSPESLFALSEPGIWLDPSDLTTMFTDTAGTTQAAVGQAVARINDKSGNGFHATQSTTTARPILARIPEGGRRNLLVRTEDLTNAAWVKINISASSGAESKLIPSASNVEHRAFQEIVTTSAVGTTVRVSVELKAAEYGFGYVGSYNGSTYNYAIVDLSDGSIDAQSVSGSPSVVDAGGGWWRISISGQIASFSGSLRAYIAVCPIPSAAVALTSLGIPTFLGDGTSGGFVRYPQLELGSTATDYQKVVSTYDVTEAGKADLYHLVFDGTDDWLVTPTITPGIDKAQVFAGARVVAANPSVTQILVESSADIGSNTGVFEFDAYASNGGSKIGDNRFRSKGTTLTSALNPNLNSEPRTSVLTGLGDISGDNVLLRVNGNQVAQSTADQGTGNYLAHPLYIGRRGGVSAAFNGHLYSLIVRFGANLDAGTISSTEGWVAGKTGVTL